MFLHVSQVNNIKMESNPIVSFCQARKEYECCIEYFSKQNFSSIDDFLKDSMHIIEFSTMYQELAFGKFVADYKSYEQEQKALATLREQLSFAQPLPSECGHECCPIILAKVEAVLSEVRSIKEQMEVKRQEDRRWILNELRKIETPGMAAVAVNALPVTVNSTQPIMEDIALEEKWMVRGEALLAAANDGGTHDLTNLYDAVFGKDLLKQFRTMSQFPDDLSRASDQLLDHYVKAKLAIKGGEYNKWMSQSRTRLTKRFDNYARYMERSNKRQKPVKLERSIS